MSRPVHPQARCRAVRSARWFTAIAAALCGLALTVTTAAAAQAATTAVPARSSSSALPAPHPIPVNTANWSGSAGFGSRAPAWYTDRSGVVHLQGAAHQTSSTGASANLIGTLPPAARPATWVSTIVHTFAGTFATLLIDPNGRILVEGVSFPAVNDWSFVSLEGITYRSTVQGTPIGLNTANWTGTLTDFRAPVWYRDDSGVVHLQGAVSQTSASGTSPNLIGTLPAAAAPRHSVYTIVHTFNGTYADLSIGSNGQISLIDPRSPMVKDYTFASLEGITYRR